MTPGPRRHAAVAALLLAPLALSGCGADQPAPSASTAGPSAGSSSGSGPAPSRGSSTGSAPASTPGSSPGVAPRGGPSSDPTVVTAGTDLLHWQPVPGPVDTTVTRDGRTTLAVDQAGTTARITAPGAGTTTISSGPDRRISDALLDGDWAVVVLQDRQESRPSVAQVVNVADDQQSFTLDGHSDLPTVNGGTWSLGDGHLVHATEDKGRYCAATVDLGVAASTLGWCAPPRHGFNSARTTPYGDAILSFDDSRPSCRTVGRMDALRLEPFPGVPDCTAWDGLLTRDGAVWAVVPNERQVEQSHVYARSGDGYVDLGPAVSGSLTWCDGAAWFARDPQTDRGPATLMRWTPGGGLDVAYRTDGGHAFLEAPRCGGSTITITARAQSGDRQLSADLG